MTTKMKKVISIFLCFIISFGIYFYICLIVAPKDINDSGGTHYYRGMGFMAEPVNSLDVVVYGNSDVYSGFAPAVLFDKYGYTSYASGRPLQTLNNINLLLDKTLKTQKPKIAILETDCFYKKSKFQIDESNILLSPFMFHSRWKELKARDFYKIPSRKNKVDMNKGLVPSNKVFKTKYPTDYMGDKNAKPKPMPKENLKYVEQFVSTCKKNNIEVLFLELPSASSWDYSKHNYVKALAEKHGVEFIDMNTPLDGYELNLKTDFRDNGNHMNITGASKATEYIGKYILEKYPNLLKDKRNDKKYVSWHNSVKHYNGLLKKV